MTIDGIIALTFISLCIWAYLKGRPVKKSTDRTEPDHTSSTDTRSIEKLANICAMLTSNHEAERATAALLATRMLNELGLDWRQFTQRALAEVKVDQSQERDWQDGGHELNRYLELLAWDGLTDWERTFVLSLYDWHPKPLSEKQRFHLWKIIQKYEASRHAF